MSETLSNREQVKELLLGVQLTCFFAVVGLMCYAVGWVKSRQVHAPAMGTWSSQLVEPIPGWVESGLYLAIAVLLISVVIDVYLLFDDDETDIKSWFQELG